MSDDTDTSSFDTSSDTFSDTTFDTSIDTSTDAVLDTSSEPLFEDTTSEEPSEQTADFEMSTEDSAELLDTWEADCAETSEQSEDALTCDELLEQEGLPTEDSVENYSEEIGHFDLADIEAARELQNAEVTEGLGAGNNSAGDGLDAIAGLADTYSARSEIAANNEMADKMREYTIAQGHSADYTDVLD